MQLAMSSKKKFEKIYIEICNTCNLTCAFCPRSSQKPQYMSSVNFSHVISEVSPFTDLVCLHVMGEPLLHPQLAEILCLCEKKSLQVNLTTNGTLLPLTAPLLLDSPALRQVNISLHSQTETSENSACSSATYLNNVFDFCDKAARENRPIISLRLWNNTNGKPNPDNRELYEAVGKHFSLTLPDNPDTAAYSGIKLRARVYLNLSDSFEWPSLENPDLGAAGYCHGLRRQLAILADGRVVPCCLDAQGEINLGNIFTTELSDILKGSRAQAIQQGFSRRNVVEALCRHCSYKNRFNAPSNLV